ncbi:hypothetical protein FRX31_010808 [Thalictrum thalictroides]|uniref:Uncharacterized protein n=1 Tax=Thalictrum thalictroides TaxID=46969 RepID=A0A7J6WT13_THATH|nr:hypothetical protein FRX31_010808 [Thalictrum thalictroides]
MEVIGATCVEYYKNLYNPVSMQPMDFSMFDNAPIHMSIGEDVACRLIKDVNRDEITQALADIHIDKAP